MEHQHPTIRIHQDWVGAVLSFELSEVETLTQSMLREFAANEVRPHAGSIDSAGSIPDDLLSRCWETGIVQALLDDDPRQRSRVLSCVILEELGWADASTAISMGSSMAYAQAIMDQGTASQREALGRLGETPFMAAVLVQEPGLASHPGSLSTVLRKEGDDFILTGTKRFAPIANRCGQFLVLARSDSAVQALIVPADANGVEIENPQGTLGVRGLALSTISFNDVRLSGDASLGGDNGCDKQRIIASSRIGTAAILTGLSRAVFEHIAPYAKERVAHGSALARKQSVAFRLADMVIDVPAMRWMCWRAASALEKGRDAIREARLAQIYCGERALAIADEGVQLMGGHGYIRDNPVERWLRDARTVSLLEGLVGV